LNYIGWKLEELSFTTRQTSEKESKAAAVCVPFYMQKQFQQFWVGVVGFCLQIRNPIL
jgi:hypothetical protein